MSADRDQLPGLTDSGMRDVAVLMTDMANSSAFAERFGGRAALQKRQRHNELLLPAISRCGGEFIESAGDSLLAIFEQSEDALLAASALQQVLADFNTSSEIDVLELEIHIRVALHRGKLMYESSAGRVQVAGQAVNTTARVLTAIPEAGRIWATEAFRGSLRNDAHSAWKSLPCLDAKGIGGIEVCELSSDGWRSCATPPPSRLTMAEGSAGSSIDVRPATTPLRRWTDFSLAGRG